MWPRLKSECLDKKSFSKLLITATESFSCLLKYYYSDRDCNLVLLKCDSELKKIFLKLTVCDSEQIVAILKAKYYDIELNLVF